MNEPVKDPEPRASVGQRIVAAVYAAVLGSAGWSGWGHIRYDAGISYAFGWAQVAIAVVYVPPFVYAVVSGRMLRSIRLMLNWAFYNETFPQTMARVAKEQEEVRKRTREM